MGSPRSRPVTVMHIIARMNVGGPAVEITELMRGLDPELVSQCLVTGYCDEDEADFLDTQATDIEAIRIKGLGRSLRPTEDLRAFFELVKLIRQSQPDVVHTHTAKAGVLGRMAARLSGTRCKIVHTYHGHLLHGYFSPLKAQAMLQVERRLARISDRLIAVGGRVRDDLIDAGVGVPHQFEVIRFGPRWRDSIPRDDARMQLGLDSSALVVAVVGRIVQIKRPDRLVAVMRLVRDEVSNVCFAIAGGGDLSDDLRERIDQEGLPAVMLGWQNDVGPVFAASDAYLLVSDNEGTPVSALEASAAGLPIVSTRVGSMDEVVEDGVSGLLTTPDVPAIGQALVSLLADAQKRKSFGIAGRSRVHAKFDPAIFLMEHQNCYLSVHHESVGPSSSG